jgi:hypothetical protein
MRATFHQSGLRHVEAEPEITTPASRISHCTPPLTDLPTFFGCGNFRWNHSCHTHQRSLRSNSPHRPLSAGCSKPLSPCNLNPGCPNDICGAGVGDSPSTGNRNFPAYPIIPTQRTAKPSLITKRRTILGCTCRKRLSAVPGRFALPNRNPNVVALSL